MSDKVTEVLNELDRLLKTRVASFWNDDLWILLYNNQDEILEITDKEWEQYDSLFNVRIWSMLSWFSRYMLRKTEKEDVYYGKVMNLDVSDSVIRFYQTLTKINKLYATPSDNKNDALLKEIIIDMERASASKMDDFYLSALRLHFALARNEYEIINTFSMKDFNEDFLNDIIRDCDDWLKKAQATKPEFICCYKERGLLFRTRKLRAYVRLNDHNQSEKQIDDIINGFEGVFDKHQSFDGEVNSIKAKAYNDVSVNYTSILKHEKAKEYLNKSKVIYEKLNASVFLINELNNRLMLYNNNAISLMEVDKALSEESQKKLFEALKSKFFDDCKRNQKDVNQRVLSNKGYRVAADAKKVLTALNISGHLINRIEKNLNRVNGKADVDETDLFKLIDEEAGRALNQELTDIINDEYIPQLGNYNLSGLMFLLYLEREYNDFVDMKALLNRLDIAESDLDKITKEVDAACKSAKDELDNAYSVAKETEAIRNEEIYRLQVGRYKALLGYTKSRLIDTKAEKITCLQKDALDIVRKTSEQINKMEDVSIQEKRLQNRALKQCCHRMSRLEEDPVKIKQLCEEERIAEKEEKKCNEIISGKGIR